MATLPEAVRRQGERADALIAQAQQADTGANPPANIAAIPGGAQGQASSATPQSPADDAAYKAKYEALQGKYNAEIKQPKGELLDRVQQLSSDNERLSRELQALQVAPKVPPPARKPVDDTYLASVRTEYPELAPALEAQHKMLTDKDGEIESLRGQVEQMSSGQVQERQDRYLADLASRVPDWEQVNARKEWADWLLQVDPRSGRSFDELLKEAHQAGNAARVAGFFNEYQQQGSTAAPNVATDPRERAVQPDTRGASAGDPAHDGRPVYQKADIQRFYTELARGRQGYLRRYAMTEAQLVALDADIMAAGQEGRIV